jgi:hypothetical protein
MDAMQFRHALDRILREILLANPAFGPVYLIKLDISDGFYRIALNVNGIPKIGRGVPDGSWQGAPGGVSARTSDGVEE